MPNTLLSAFLRFCHTYRQRLWSIALPFLLFPLIASCSLPKVVAQDRGFLDLQLKFLSEYQLPKQNFQDTPVGGLSGLTYDRQRDLFYAISDDRSNFFPARFYTLKLSLESDKLTQVAVEKVTFLKDQEVTYASGTIDPEGLALSPIDSLFISSEGTDKAPPFIQEYDLITGNKLQSISLPQRFLPTAQAGIQPNLGFESLAIAGDGNSKGDPYRLFAALESPLKQDINPETNSEINLNQPPAIRLLHYLFADPAPPLLISENLYQLDKEPAGTLIYGLTDLMTLPERGFFLGLERSYGLLGDGAKIYQITTGNATDTSSIPSLRTISPSLQPIRKKLVLDLATLGIKLDNLEGMALGARLADGSQSLILVSDDNFSSEQITQFLLFSLKIGSRA